MARPRPKATVIQERRSRVARLMVNLERPTAPAIAMQLKITEKQAYGDMVAVKKEWRTQRLADLDSYMDSQLAKLDALEEDARRTLARSFESTTVVKRKFSPEQGEAMRLEEEERTVRPPRPSTAAMRVILDCIEARSKLLGLNVAGKELEGDPGQVFAFTMQIGQDLKATMSNDPDTLDALANSNGGRPIVIVDSEGKKHLPDNVLGNSEDDETPS